MAISTTTMRCSSPATCSFQFSVGFGPGLRLIGRSRSASAVDHN